MPDPIEPKLIFTYIPRWRCLRWLWWCLRWLWWCWCGPGCQRHDQDSLRFSTMRRRPRWQWPGESMSNLCSIHSSSWPPCTHGSLAGLYYIQYRSVTHVSIWRQHWPFDGCRVSTSISYRKTVCPLLSLSAVYCSCGKYTRSIWLWCPMTKGLPSTLNAFCLLFCSANVMNSCIPWNTHPVQRKKTSEMIIVVTLF